MSKTENTRLAGRAAAACIKLSLFMEGEIQLTETQFEGLQDELLQLLEESNNHRYRFGRTRPKDTL